MDELTTPTPEINPEPAPAPAEPAAGVETPSAPPPAPSAAEEPAPAAEPAAPVIEIEYPEEAEPAAAAEAAEAEGTLPPLRYGTAALTRLLKEHPALAAAPEPVRKQLYAMARRSQELAQYHELAPSMGKLREALGAAGTLGRLEQAYRSGEPAQFWGALREAAGDPAAHARQMRFLQQDFVNQIELGAVRAQNANLTAAVRSIREAMGWTPTSPAQERATAESDDSPLPPHIRQRLEHAEANARELEQLRTRRSEETARQTESFFHETATEVATQLRNFVDGLLANAKLSDYDKRNIGRDFIESISALADQDKVQAAALEEIFRAGGPTPQTRSRMVARATAWARQNGREVLEPILTRAGAGLRQRQADREARQARQRPEPAIHGAPAAPVQATARDLVAQAEKRAGRRLTDREILELA